MLQAALAAGITEAGGDALLGGVLPTPGRAAARAPLRLRPGGGDQRLAQPVRRQRHQVLRPRRLQAVRRRRAGDRARARAAAVARAAGRAASRTCCGTQEDYLRELHTRFGEPRPGRPATCCWTAPTARPTRSRRRSSAGWAPRSPPWPPTPTGATSTTAAARPTSRCSAAQIAQGGHDIGFAFDGDGDRVLAVDRTGTVVDGDELVALAALHLQVPGVAHHGDDQLRLPHGDERGRGGDRHHGGRRPLRARGAARARRGAWAASSRATSSTWPSARRVTASPARC